MPKFAPQAKVQVEGIHDATGTVTDIYPGTEPMFYQYWVVFPFPIAPMLLPETRLKLSPNLDATQAS